MREPGKGACRRRPELDGEGRVVPGRDVVIEGDDQPGGGVGGTRLAPVRRAALRPHHVGNPAERGGVRRHGPQRGGRRPLETGVVRGGCSEAGHRRVATPHRAVVVEGRRRREAGGVGCPPQEIDRCGCCVAGTQNCTAAAAQWKPAPKAVSTTRSPGRILPASCASQSAKGTDADPVLPYSSTLT